MKNFSILQDCNLVRKPLIAMMFGVFLLASCGKDVAEKNLAPKEDQNQQWRSTLDDLSSTTNLDQGCDPNDFGFSCSDPYVSKTHNITNINGCTFEVIMGIKECYFGQETHLVFKLIGVGQPQNANVEPCKSWWDNIINLPDDELTIEWNALEDRLTSEFIRIEMEDYVIRNPSGADCDEGLYYHSSFFKPICNKLCYRPGLKELPQGFYYSITCATGGCCVETTHYCLNDGEVKPIAGGKQLLSPCTDFNERECKKFSYEVFPCNQGKCE
jgi:hypothetical protein